MASASTLVRFVNLRIVTAAILTIIAMAACTSPTDLDVDRSKTYMDGAVHPHRLSFYYYFGDSAYEAIVTDTAMLNSIWIERGTTPWQVTIPLLQFDLPDSIHASGTNTPFPTTVCFSTTKQLADGVFRSCTNPDTWVSGEYIDLYGGVVPFTWLTDNAGRQLRIGYYKVDNEDLVKASLQIVLQDPVRPGAYATYRALVTLEF